MRCERDFFDFRFFPDFSAVLPGMIEKKFVELGTRDLIGAIALRAVTILEIEFYAFGSACRDNFASEFRQERAIKLFADPEPIECLGAEREKRFADVEPGKALALEELDASNVAAVLPAGPPPMMATSYMSILLKRRTA